MSRFIHARNTTRNRRDRASGQVELNRIKQLAYRYRGRLMRASDIRPADREPVFLWLLTHPKGAS